MSSTIERNGEAEKKGAGRPRNRQRTAKGADNGREAKNKAQRTGKHPVVRGFGKRRQRQFLELLLQGASPHVACSHLQLADSLFWQALERDVEFAEELQHVWDALSYNVVAALYKAAIKGNNVAQQFWLKHRPPPRWSKLPGGEVSGDELEALTNDELLERARQEAPDLAAEIAARAAKTGIRLAPQTLPGADPPAGE